MPLSVSCFIALQVAAAMAAEGLDPAEQLDASPGTDRGGGVYGGRPALLDEPALEAAANCARAVIAGGRP